MNLSLTPLLTLAVVIIVLTPWMFAWYISKSQKSMEKLWRETLVYLKSASAYEAEDAIDRIEERGKGKLKKGLENLRKEDENLNEDTGLDDMTEDFRSRQSKHYDNDTGSGK